MQHGGKMSISPLPQSIQLQILFSYISDAQAEYIDKQEARSWLFEDGKDIAVPSDGLPSALAKAVGRNEATFVSQIGGIGQHESLSDYLETEFDLDEIYNSFLGLSQIRQAKNAEHAIEVALAAQAANLEEPEESSSDTEDENEESSSDTEDGEDDN